MIGRGFRIGRILGFPIRIDLSWLAIVFLLTVSLSAAFEQSNPELGLASRLSLGLSASFLLFGSVLAHELSHAVVARRHDVGIRGITLFIFGGAAEMVEEPKRPVAELQIAIAGPLMSLLLAIAFASLHQSALDSAPSPLLTLAELLSRMNFMLVAFNAVPGFPLDGGRVLRALLWGIWGKLAPATRVAAGVGAFFGVFVIALGFAWIFLLDNFIGGLWFVFIGFFLRNAARTSYHQLTMRGALAGVRARDLMARDVATVGPGSRLADVVGVIILPKGVSEVPVVEGGRLLGMLRLQNIRAREKAAWEWLTAGDVMSRDVLDEAIHPDDESLKVLALVGDEDRMFPVVEDGRFLGLLSRDDVLRRLKLHLELGSKLTSEDEQAAPHRENDDSEREREDDLERK
ncbi:MAG TPA: site-2 protease family protein [Vicinamibacteria bacterium]|nr:site-2 protease family protein [Vicinamibacteria bacterium]